jgi:3-hydroxyisobutyrate dehydrogenase-like beta-hydroxyacid dehydrogenase
MRTHHHDAGDAIAILGLGKVGTAVGHLLKAAGYRIIAVADQSPAALNKGIPFTGGQACKSLAEAAAAATCIVITTTDDMIEQGHSHERRRGA